MKILSLEITNIASIEHALIEFDKPPLSQDPIFLICGDTGAGKTTILNSICLALYNTAPNLKSVNGNAKDIDDVTINNPLQLVRRGTASASIELIFEANNGHIYKVEWLARRARGKADGRFQPLKRILHCAETDETCNNSELDRRIPELIGLSYEQFCRTTMLAQGQFSKFMLANDEDKAAILEKLTGTEIYSKIGRRIFERMKSCAERVNLLQHNIDINTADLLSQEDRQSLSARISLLKGKADESAALMRQAEIRLRWFSEMAVIDQALGQASAQVAALREKATDPESKKQAQCVEAWDATTAIRSLMVSQTQLKSRLEQLKKDIGHKSDEYGCLIATIEFMEEDLAAKSQYLDILSRKHLDDDIHKPIYDSIITIKSLIQVIRNHDAELKKLDTNISEHKARIESLTINLVSAKKSTEICLNRLKGQQQVVDELSAEVEKLDMETLTSNLERSNNLCTKVVVAQDLITNINDRQAEYQSLSDEVRQIAAQIAESESQKVAAEKSLPDIQQRCDALENQYRGKVDLRDHLAQLSQRFAQTHECPLCGSHVSELRSYEIIDEDINHTLKLLEEAQAEYKTQRRTLDSASIALCRHKADHARLSASLTSKAAALDDATSKAASTCAELGIATIDDNTPTLLLERKKEIDHQKGLDAQALKSAQERVIALKNTQNALQKLNFEYQSSLKIQQDLDSTIKEASAAMQSNCEVRLRIAAERVTSFDNLMSMVTPDLDLREASLDVIDKTISRMADEYSRRSQLISDTTKEIDTIRGRLTRSREMLSGVDAIFPTIKPTSKSDIAEPERAVIEFVRKVNIIQGEISSTQNSLAQITSEISSYFAANKDYDADYINMLISIGHDSIAAYRRNLDHLKSDLAQAEGALAQTNARKATHIKSKPQMPDDVNIGQLTKQISDYENSINCCRDELAKISATLEADRRSAANVEHLQNQLQDMRRERDNWRILDDAFGASDGAKFKRIAQSYVLSALLTKANYYMALLSGRYRLNCRQGSLSIDVVDQMQGGITRGVALLSGGEGFVVSLALALGLSDISTQRLCVDTLFIDEGFGSLSPDYLETVIHTLDKLHSIGHRRVGIISHVPGLASRIPTQIQLRRHSPSSSSVHVVTSF